MEIKLPEKGFTKSEKQWLKTVIEAIKSNKAIAGENVTVDNREDGQVINAHPPDTTTPTA